MKNLLIVFSALFITGYIFTSATAKQSPQIDEIDALLSRVSKNIQSAGEVTKMAQTMNAKMVEAKVEEKKALQKEVAKAESKIEAMATTMMFMGVDTSLVGMDTASISNMMRLNGIK
jgi:putative heme iron utilization protein